VERCPSWASSIIPHVPNQPKKAATCPGNRPASMVTSCPTWSTSICQGLFPTNLCQRRPDEGVLPPLCAWAHHKTLSCICHPNVHLMGSSTPWRSELIISPCAPILWYLSAGHGPAHQKGYALQGLISPKHHGNVNQISSLKLSNVCMTPLTNLLIAQKPYTDPPYKVKATKG
jgi:hypothetical protein